MRQRLQVGNGLLQIGFSVLAVEDGARVSGDGVQHLQLAWNLVDNPAVPAEKFAVDLAGNVQDAASRRQRLHHGAGRIAGSGTGAGQGNTELAACPGVSIGCIHRGGFVAHGDEGKFTVHGFHQGEVVDADDAEGGVDPVTAHHPDQYVPAVGSVG